MFSKNLADKLLQLMGERGFTQENIAEICHISDRYVRNILSERQTPSLTTFEKICEGLEVDPNDLLISEKSKRPEKSIPMQIEKVYAFERMCYNQKLCDTYPVCPNCGTTLEREYMSYCDRCGQRLSWKAYQDARKIYKTRAK